MCNSTRFISAGNQNYSVNKAWDTAIRQRREQLRTNCSRLGPDSLRNLRITPRIGKQSSSRKINGTSLVEADDPRTARLAYRWGERALVRSYLAGEELF
jgi:hypothetical protein